MSPGKFFRFPIHMLALLLSLGNYAPVAVASEPCITVKIASAPPATQATGGIMIVYPKGGQTIDASSTFLIGSCPAGSLLTCRGKPVKLNAQGFFAHVVDLHPGLNKFVLRRNEDPAMTATIVIAREPAYIPLPAGKATFLPASAFPAEDSGVTPGDLLPLAVRATPGGHVTVYLGKRKVTLGHFTGKDSRAITINAGMDTAYGRAFQRQAACQRDFYYGFYHVRPDDHWRKLHPLFLLRAGHHTASLSGAALTTVEQPRTACTIADETTVRLGPGLARTTPLCRGVRLLVDGWQGKWLRCLLSPGRHVWIAREDLAFDRQPGPLPAVTVRTVNIEPEQSGVRIAIPMTQRLAYQIEQQISSRRLILRICGATADTDWITQAPDAVSSLLKSVTWRQSGDRLYELSAVLTSKQQWGFHAGYEDTTLVLHIKAPPQLRQSGISGAVICLDPGHGGIETGAIGPSGVPESQINLAIAQKLKQLLVADGATVVLTRRSEDEFVSLAERVRRAYAAGADLLISIHNNALPDGRDPWKEHGTASYWYHPQAASLALALKKSIAGATGLPDFGTNYQNLALCRPSGLVAVLVEVAFMINPDEYSQLISPAFQEKAARALADGIKNYLLSACRDRQAGTLEDNLPVQ